jgi:hypothetical protein
MKHNTSYLWLMQAGECTGDRTVSQTEFHQRLADLTAELAGRPLDAARDGVAAGWLCDREGGGIRYGRIFKPAPDLHGFSVDVVDMQDVKGPHHAHPNGEIDLIMPIEGDATFDGRGAGWLVCPPGSAHRPTVAGGRALVLYLLPEGRIEFSR